MGQEVYGLPDAGTFEPISQPVDNFINAMWVFDWKADEYGWPTKTKARLVVRGGEQRANIEFGELFAPTVALSSVCLLTAMACELDLDLCHFDVEQAFVQSDPEENVFMRFPQGCGRLSGKFVILTKSLHGLKQASRQWHAHLTRCLQTLFFLQCLADAGIFRLLEGRSMIMTTVMHVDGIFAVGEKERCDQFRRD